MVRLRFVALLLVLASSVSAAEYTLADQGQAKTVIVIAEKASPETKATAHELAAYLKRITGAEFKVVTGDGSTGLVLGTLAEFPNPALAKPLAIRNTYDGKEAFVIRSEKERLLLIGATELAVPHAAFTLLEHLGCRWFFPAKEWEVVPQRPTVTVNLDLAERPRILARRIWYGYGPFPDDKKHPFGGSCAGDYNAWAKHNRMAASFRVYAGHAYEGLVAANKKAFDEHPEYFALVKDKRQGPQLCLSNPAVRELGFQWVRDFFKRSPDREMVSLDCADGDGQCECEHCRKLGSVSNRVFGLANDAAKMVQKEYPGKMVGLLAYSEHSEPPDFTLEPNVYVQLTLGFTRGRYTFEELRDLWPKKCQSMGFYDYYSVWLWDFDKLPGGRGSNLEHIAEMIRTSAKLGATSIDAESGNNWGVHGLGYYVSNKLLWNPDADVAALTIDFYTQAFGPAAKPMRRYYERWMPTRHATPIISRQFIGTLYRDVQEACTLANERPDVLARLTHMKHYLHYNYLRWLFDHEKDKAKQKQLALDILTFTYRTRYEYMNHWNAIQSSFASDVAKRFDEPTWNRNDRTAKPWTNANVPTHDETEQWFQAGLAYYQPFEVTTRTFDYSQLVPVEQPIVKPLPHQQAFQRVERYALASAKGEDVQLNITVGTIAWYRDRADARWTLHDAKNKKIADGILKLDGEAKTYSIKVPAAGVYYFELNDSAAGWRIKADAGASLTWLPEQGRRVIGLGQMPEMYFYVPQGTKELHYFWSGSPHKVLGPDRKVIAETTTNDEVVRIPVPAGMDGKVWSFTARNHASCWFFNAPNCWAASPNGLLIPRNAK